MPHRVYVQQLVSGIFSLILVSTFYFNFFRQSLSRNLKLSNFIRLPNEHWGSICLCDLHSTPPPHSKGGVNAWSLSSLPLPSFYPSPFHSNMGSSDPNSCFQGGRFTG